MYLPHESNSVEINESVESKFDLPGTNEEPNFLNQPEAIWNLVTPVATPRSVRLGFFNLSGHTTVFQIGFFF